jgi:hypothetical protein
MTHTLVPRAAHSAAQAGRSAGVLTDGQVRTYVPEQLAGEGLLLLR